MLLKSLEIQGFKTFPDKTTLKFEADMVAVVGPNGSGKSNVSDAIRWVLGEQSTRILRCNKMEDVIFKGTTSRKALGFAEVTMNIDNTDRNLNFDGDNIAITRRYYRSGESEYLINKASVRLKDINELFMDTGLGRDGYSIIGQGKIDSIVSAKSEDRREIFEEAAGISRYRYRKEESERRLERTEENLVRLRDILSELEGRVEPLRIQSEKAQNFLTYDTEKRGLEIGIWVETLNRSGKILREQEDKMNLAAAEHEDTETAAERLTVEIEENFAASNACTLQMENERGAAAHFDEEATRAEGEISVLRNDILHNRANMERLQKELGEAQNSGNSMDEEILGKKAEIAEKNKDIDGHNSEYIRFAEELENLRKGSDTVTKEIDDGMIGLAKINAALSEERVQYSSLSSSVTEIESRKGSVEAALLENTASVEALETEKAELQEMLTDIKGEITGKENALQGYLLRLEGRKKKADGIKSELDKTVLDASEQSRRAKILEDLERNFEGFTQSVKIVMKEAERGMLRGIHGPVTKILKTPREYAVAIETALGGAMQNVVVATEQDAKAAIHMLKQRDSGRATFLPLSTVKGFVIDQREAATCGGFVGIAAELVECAAIYSGIKASLLGRTAVADTLDSAVAIAKKTGYRFRVVTLDGQVVNAGGSLTGGSLARNSGLLSRASEIERIREKAKALTEQGEVFREELKKITAAFSALEAEISAVRGELNSLQEDKFRTASALTGAEKELETTVALGKQLHREQEDSEKRIGEITATMSRTYLKINQFELSLKEANARLDSLSGNKEDQQKFCDELSRKIQEIRIWSLSAQKDKEALEYAVESLISRKQDSFGLLERLQGELNLSENNILALETSISERAAAVETLRGNSAAKRNAIENLAATRTALEQKSGELRKLERDTLTRRENIGQEIARLQERRDNLQKEYDTIITKLWEEYELTPREAEEQGVPIEDFQKAQRRLTELKNKIKALGSVNVAAIVEYQEVRERFEFLTAQVGDVEKSKSELIKLIAELTHHMQEQFTVRFEQINRNFNQIFKELFGGGTATLSFSDENDILNSGIEIQVHPPGKIVAHIEALSGGEKALVAISIYFAIMKVSPPPFCMLDEVEAALDDVNVRRFADYLHKMNGQTQFIVITHRRGTMEEADMLYGVTMQDDGISKILSLKTQEVEEKLGMKST